MIKINKTVAALVALWFLIVIGVVVNMARYEFQPGLIAAPPLLLTPQNFPKNVKNLPTLLVFLHPQCPCSHATVNELARLVARAKDLSEIHILFYQPANQSPDWVKTNLWHQAEQIPGATLSVVDEQRLESFGDLTSGQTMLYDAAGNLKFSGGITNGRGHEGDNAGRAAIENYLHTGEINVSQTPVFGCALTTSEKKF